MISSLIELLRVVGNCMFIYAIWHCVNGNGFDRLVSFPLSVMPGPVVPCARHPWMARGDAATRWKTALSPGKIVIVHRCEPPSTLTACPSYFLVDLARPI